MKPGENSNDIGYIIHFLIKRNPIALNDDTSLSMDNIPLFIAFYIVSSVNKISDDVWGIR